MINLMLGTSGGGKSYESVVFHILPALEKGREVLTNLPVNVERITAILTDPSNGRLLQTVQGEWGEKFNIKTQKMERHFWQPFSQLKDYPAENNSDKVGPLLVIDECHKSLPKMETKRDVEEWFAEHRHLRCDILLITQSYGKISTAIKDNVQLVYRVRKAVAFGFQGRYIRKVQDGVRGDIVNTSTRKYEKKFFGLYKSHTKGAEGIEGGSSDVVPIWRRWPVVAAALVMPIGVIMFAMAPPIFPDQSKANAAMLAAAKSAPKIVPEVIKPNVEAVQSAAVNVVSATPPAAAKAEAKTEEPMDPYGGKGIHYQGKMSIGGKLIHLFGVSQGSAMITSVTSDELERAGYRVRIVGDCTGWIYYGKTERPVVCDSGAMVVGGTPAIRQGKAPEGSPAGGGAGDNTAKSETPRTASRPAPPRPGSAS